jgi:hypothetical protein
VILDPMFFLASELAPAAESVLFNLTLRLGTLYAIGRARDLR